MYLISKLKLFSIVGVSVIGSIFHSIGQVLIGMLLINYNIIYYLPYFNPGIILLKKGIYDSIIEITTDIAISIDNLLTFLNSILSFPFKLQHPIRSLPLF